MVVTSKNSCPCDFDDSLWSNKYPHEKKSLKHCTPIYALSRVKKERLSFEDYSMQRYLSLNETSLWKLPQKFESRTTYNKPTNTFSSDAIILLV